MIRVPHLLPLLVDHQHHLASLLNRHLLRRRTGAPHPLDQVDYQASLWTAHRGDCIRLPSQALHHLERLKFDSNQWVVGFL